MSTFTGSNSELDVDVAGAGQQHRASAGGMTVALERWSAGLDTAEWFASSPTAPARSRTGATASKAR
jgi:hypothetical protein